MADVASNIWRLADVFAQDRESRRQDARTLADIGAQRANIAITAKNAEGEQAAKLAKAKRDQLLDEPVTVGQAIDTHPSWTDQDKENIKSSIAGKHREAILNFPTTRRKANEAIMSLRKEYAEEEKAKSEQAYRDKMLNIRQQEVNVQKEKSGQDEYKLSQQMDDLRGEYKTAIDTLKDEYGQISDKAMQRKISEAYRKDKRLIRKNVVPHFLDDLMGSEDKRVDAGLPPLPEGAVLLP